MAASFIPFSSFTGTGGIIPDTVYAEDGYTIPDLSIESKDIPDLDCFRFTADMGAGINLGNTLDAVDDAAPKGEANLYLESAWVGVETTKAMIDNIRNEGYKTIRIPVSWHNHVDDNFRINEEWLNRVKEIVDYAIDNGMYAIINIHHDNEYDYMFPKYSYLDNSIKYVDSIWTQVGEKFKNYDEHLVFETLNEPRVKFSNYEWWYTSSADECKEAADCINKYNQAAVDAIRKTGGNNSDRYIMVPSYCAKLEAAITNEFKLPEDSAKNRLILSVHAYIPYNFAMNGADQEGSTTEFGLYASDAQEIDNMMDTIYIKFISKNIPVIIGEYGARNKNENTQARTEYSAYYAASARARGITCIWWDNNCFETYAGEAFGLLDRNTNTWKYDSIAKANIRYGDGSKAKYVEPWYNGGGGGGSTKLEADILPDGTATFPAAIGDKIELDIELNDGIAQWGGCLSFMIALNGTNYWVAYQWAATESGKITVDMTTPTKAVDTSKPEGSNEVSDQYTLQQIAELVQKSSSTTIQYWWACDSDWNNLDGPFENYGTIKSASLSDSAPVNPPVEPTEPPTEAPTDAPTDAPETNPTETTTDSSTQETIFGEPTHIGDINGDSEVSVSDVVKLNLYLLNSEANKLSAVQMANADCCRDYVIDTSDSGLLMNYVAMIVDYSALGKS